MIDHLVEEYGVDPNGVDEYGWTALHNGSESGRVRTVKHLVEKHNVDIHKRMGAERLLWTWQRSMA
jgi:ankyrin repeat protein